MLVLGIIFKLKLVFGVKSDRFEFGFKMFPVVDLTNQGDHFFSLGLYLKKKDQKFGKLNKPYFQNDSNLVIITQN